MSDQWQAEPSGSGMLGRLLVPQSSTRPAMTAFLAGLAGTAAFVASLVLDFQRITIDVPSNGNSGGSVEDVVFTAGVGSIETLGLVYLLGCLGLVTMFGAVLVRPDAALRLRMGVAGLGLGLIGVLVAITIRLPETIFNSQLFYGGVFFSQQEELLERTTVAYEPGMFVAFAAVALLTGAVWLAGVPAARAAAKWAEYAAEFPEAARYYSAYYYAGQPLPPAPNGSAVPAQPDRSAAGVDEAATAPGSGGPTVGASTQSGTDSPPASIYGPAPAAPTFTPPVASTYHPPPATSYATPPSDWSRPGQMDGLSVSASEPIDPTASPDSWRS